MNKTTHPNPSTLRYGLTTALLAALAAWHPAQASEMQATPTELVDAINNVFGKQTDNRAIHAKGIVLEGSFLPNSESKTLTKASHLRGGNLPVLVLFSSFAGIPTISDVDDLASPRGIAIKF